MAAAENKKSFWEIFAIVVGAIAALITAIAALLAAMNGGKEGASKPEVAPTVQAASTKADKVAGPTQGDTITDEATGMVLVYVPGGCFKMGSSSDDKDHQEDEGPVHEVCVDGFYMGKYEVTQGQWQKIMGSNPSAYKNGGNYPVENVSWNDAQDFIKKLNSAADKQYRLPTEAEWEYACRANGSSKYCGGDDVDAVAWYGNNSGDSTHPVGEKLKNAFGLHDMSGNVWEWCSDWYDSDYYASSPKSNPTGPDSGESRVFRGGSWSNSPLRCRAVIRITRTPLRRFDNLGFRLVLPVR